MTSIFTSQKIIVHEPLLSKKLFSEVGPWSLVWLILRVYLGWEWVNAGWEKLSGTTWGPAALRGFWQHAILIPTAPARPAIAYDWYRSFLETLLNAHAETWMAPLVAYGELLVGAALVLGIFTGIAAFFGAFMNINFMLAGTASIIRF